MAWPPSVPPTPPKKPKPGALIDAVQMGNFNEIRRLLKEKADVNERDTLGNSALSCAVSAGWIEIIRLLLDNGANVDSRNALGNTPLMVVIPTYFANREAIARMLLDRDANMDIKNNDGDTAMTLAVKKARPQMISLLKETTVKRERLAKEFARVAEAKRRTEIAERQERLKEIARKRPKPGPGPKPPEAA